MVKGSVLLIYSMFCQHWPVIRDLAKEDRVNFLCEMQILFFADKIAQILPQPIHADAPNAHVGM